MNRTAIVASRCVPQCKPHSIIAVSSDDFKAFEKGKIKSFERKYGCNIYAFEKKLARSPEDFECWDDFIEWKAYADSLNDLESKSALASGKAHD